MKVLASPASRNGLSNPYQWLLYGNVRQLGVRVCEWTKRDALVGKWDIVHIHWPEAALGRRPAVRALARARVYCAVLDWLRLRGAKVVWTAHNLHPHERVNRALEGWFYNHLCTRVDGAIHLSGSARRKLEAEYPCFAKVQSAVIPHGHYRDVYPNCIPRWPSLGPFGHRAQTRAPNSLSFETATSTAVGRRHFLSPGCFLRWPRMP